MRGATADSTRRTAKRQRNIVRVAAYDRVCPICHGGPLLQMDGYIFCAAEDPHPGGVRLYSDGAVVRSDRNLHKDLTKTA